MYWDTNTSKWTIGSSTIRLGTNAGYTNQGANAIALGNGAGKTSQGANSIAIGNGAGQTSQGSSSICIGSQSICSYTNSIVINSSGMDLSAGMTGAFYVAPIRTASSTGALLIWNPSTKEIQASRSTNTATNKSFIINHPDDDDKYLVHVCLEGPEIGVYYRGKGEITNDDHIIISLPDYAQTLCRDFTIHATPIATCKTKNVLSVSEVIDNQFTVYGDNGRFNWVAFGKRGDIIVEPLKTEVDIDGFGPYKWIM